MTKYLDTTKLSIREIDRKLARDMVIKNHYSQKWTKCSVALGLYYSDGTQHKFFDMEDEKLIGVICYGDPIGRHSGASISTEIPRENVYELVRLFIHDGYGDNIESYLIGQGFKWLKKNQNNPLLPLHPGLSLFVSKHCCPIYILEHGQNWSHWRRF